jgi:hypothetical protein
MPRERFFDSDGVKLHTIDWGGAGRPMGYSPGSAIPPSLSWSGPKTRKPVQTAFH